MVVKKGAVLLITLFLASASFSLAHTEKLDQCLDLCQSRRQQVLSCQGRCAHDYYRQRHDFEQEDEEWLNPSARMHESCERQCRREPRLQRGLCQMRCERERMEPHVEEEEFEMCQKRCQRDKRGYQQQMQCLKKCERQREL